VFSRALCYCRNHSLEKSSDSFPCCLVLVLDDTEVLGHSRLSSVVGKPDACFVESGIQWKILSDVTIFCI
jgi:hypothetical protein